MGFNHFHATHEVSHSEASVLFIWIYLVFEKIDERNVSCHLSTVEVTCMTFQQ